MAPNKTDPNRLLEAANRLFEGGRLREALARYTHLAGLVPPNFDLATRIATTAARLGDARIAAPYFAQALTLEPGDIEAWIGQGMALRELGRVDEAIESFDRAVALDPRNARALRFVGIMHMERGRWDDAIATWKQALGLDPRFAAVQGDLGLLYGDMGRLDDALATFDAALAIAPSDPRLRALKAEVLLLKGDYEQGWSLSESRFATAFRVNPDRARIEAGARWTGREPLAGKTILIHPEVGFGDYLMFARYIPLLERAGARVIAYCPAALSALIRSSFPSALVVDVGGQLPPFDFHCPIMSLPDAFGTTLESIPRAMPYLKVDPAKRQEWEQRLGARVARRVGIAWSNQPRPIDRSPLRRRWMALADMEPLLSLPFEFHVLQKDLSTADAQLLEGRARVRLHDSGLAAFDDTAALVELMDAVVTIDTSVAHVAGALGKPTHVVVPPACDYRWARSGDRSPWYPSATVHRRALAGSWSEPVTEIRGVLAQAAIVAA